MKITDLKDFLKEHDLRLTSARKEIFTLLSHSKKALSTKEIFDQLKKKSSKVDLASVYRNLETFQNLKIIHRLEDTKFKVCSLNHGHEHVHILMTCTKCKKTTELESHSKKICQATNEIKKLIPDIKELEALSLKGVCKSCS